MRAGSYRHPRIRRLCVELLEPRLVLDAGPIVINEIMYNTSLGTPGQAGFVADNPHLEWIELYNRSASAVNLKGWQIDKGVSFTFDPSVDRLLGAGSYLVVAANRAAFLAKYTSVSPSVVVGDWIPAGSTDPPKLSNTGENIELVDAAGSQVDYVSYGDSGDWSTRIRGPVDYNHRGLEWDNGTDGTAGKSLELINPGDGSLSFRLSNNWGENWGGSVNAGGTPGARNSNYAADTAPIVLDFQHLPAIPRHTDPVTVTAQVVDEAQANAGATVQLWYRVDGTTSWTMVAMSDDGLHGDGLAGDGTYGAVLPAQPNNTVVEMYVRATDAAGHARTWPGPVVGDAGNGQTANALYQVDDTFNPDATWTPGATPFYRIVMTEASRQDLYNIGHTATERWSDAAMNATFISMDGTGTEARYTTSVRNRGHGTRLSPGTPMNYRVGFVAGHPWMELAETVINYNFVGSQALGSTVFQAAGLEAADQSVVQERVNNTNLAETGNRQYGYFVSKESLSGDFTASHFPTDPSGNLYVVHYSFDINNNRLDEGNLRYEGTDPNSYRDCYIKQTNVRDDDYSDLIHLTYVLNASYPTDAAYFNAVSQVVNVTQWLRYIAADTLAGNLEGGLTTGLGDDYAMYRGATDTRFKLVPWDLDTLFGMGGSTPDTGRSVFAGYSSIPGLSRLFTNPDTLRIYYQQLLDLSNTVFAPRASTPLSTGPSAACGRRATSPASRVS